MKNVINSFATDHNMKVEAVKVDKMNKIIFATTFVPSLHGSDIVKEGDVVYRIDTKANTSTPITPDTIAKEAKDALVAGNGKNASSVEAAIKFGLVKKITMARGDKGTSGPSTDIAQFAKALGLSVVDVSVEPQNDIIFQTQGVKRICGLDIHDGKYFKLDTVANTATLIDAPAIAEQAATDILAGKTTDLTRFVQTYNLIASVTMAVKSDDSSED